MRNIFKLTRLLLITGFLCSAGQYSFAQKTDSVSALVKTHSVKSKKIHRSYRDSIRQTILKRDALMRSFKHSDDASLNDLLGKIEDYTSQYIQTNSDLSKGFDTLEISQRLPTLEKRMALMKNTIENSGTLGYMVTIRNMVDHVIDQTKTWEGQLSSYSDQLDAIHDNVVAFKTDSVLHTAPDDSTLEDKYVLQVEQLQSKWQKLDSCSKKSIIKIGQLQNRVSALSILLIDLDDRVDIRIHDFSVNALDNECGFIWDMHKPKNVADSAFSKTYTLNIKLYKYFLTGKSNYWSHAACIVLLLAFFAWIFNSRRKIMRVKGEDAKSVFTQTHYVIKHPYMATLMVTAIAGVYFYDHPAQIFVQTMLLVMMAAMGVLLKDNWPKPLFKFWIVLFVLAICFSISSLMIVITNTDRLLLILLSGFGIYKSYKFLKYLKKTPDEYPPYMELALKLFIALQTVSILLNVAGRFSLAKIVGCTMVFNLCLAMGVYLFVQVLMESLFIQLEANKSADNVAIASYLDFKVLQKKFKDVVIKVAVVLWLIALTKNLAIDDYLYDTASDFLNDKHKVNTTAYTFGNILIFIIIIWVSGLVARVISYFYDFAGQQTKLTLQAKKTRSSILLIRLTIFVIGFFIAVTAADIPMSQVTLVIGALGVGIGFGLQNIVNNLVSGIILAFEKPVQVGDIIEVSGKTGTITDIGIRSSKIDIGNGSELIVPNGDLISQHVINWTLTNNNRQVELIIGVAYGSDVTRVETILTDIVNNHEDIMKTPAPAVLLSNFGESSIDFKILFWAAEIGKWSSLKSKVMSEIYTKFNAEGIEIPHPKGDIQVHFPEAINPNAVAKTDVPPKENPAG